MPDRTAQAATHGGGNKMFADKLKRIEMVPGPPYRRT
jgi:hypothetical protein